MLKIVIHVYVNYIYKKLAVRTILLLNILYTRIVVFLSKFKLLFSLTVSHGDVPDDFGWEIIVLI